GSRGGCCVRARRGRRAARCGRAAGEGAKQRGRAGAARPGGRDPARHGRRYDRQARRRLGEIAQHRAEAERGLALLPDPGLARAALEAARAQATAARRRENEASALVDRLAREAETARQRLAAVAGETASWQRRRDGAVAQQAQLTERADALSAEIAELAARPA